MPVWGLTPLTRIMDIQEKLPENIQKRVFQHHIESGPNISANMVKVIPFCTNEHDVRTCLLFRLTFCSSPPLLAATIPLA